MKIKLKWKKVWLNDKSGYFFSSKVPVLGWEYVVDPVPPFYKGKKDIFIVNLFLTKFDCEAHTISNKNFKTEESAKEACEKHLLETFKKLKKLFNDK